jgi:hypothetical protein
MPESTPWDPDPETVSDIRRRLLGGESTSDVAADHPVHRHTIRDYATGEKGDADAAIGPIRPLGRGINRWVRDDGGGR